MTDREPVGAARPGAADSTSANEIADRAKQAASKAADDATDVVQDVKSRASDLGAHVGQQASSAAESGKNALAEQIGDMAEAVHRSGEQLEGHLGPVAKFVERGADELSGLVDALRSNDLRGLATKLEDMARQQPALFIGASMAAGFAAVRFTKVAASSASSSDLPQARENFNGR